MYGDDLISFIILNAPTWLLILLLAVSCSALAFSIFYFSKRNNTTVKEHIVKYRWPYIVVSICVILPVADLIANRFWGLTGALFFMGLVFFTILFRVVIQMILDLINGISLLITSFPGAKKKNTSPEWHAAKYDLSNKYCSLSIEMGEHYSFRCFKKDSRNNNVLYFIAKCVRDRDVFDETFRRLSFLFSSSSSDIDFLYRYFSDNKSFDIKIINRDMKMRYSTDNEADMEKRIDLNHASDMELSKLPGINIAIAKKIVLIRETEGLFKSFSDFKSRIKIKSRYEDRIRKMVVIDYKEPKIIEKGKRIIDI